MPTLGGTVGYSLCAGRATVPQQVSVHELDQRHAAVPEHREYRIVKSCSGLRPIRTAELLAIVVTPYRFANKLGSGATVDWGS